MKQRYLFILLIAWAVILLWPLVSHPERGPMPRVVQDSDFIIVHLSVATYIHNSLVQYGQIPLWNATIMSGQPFAGDWKSGYWYLPNWLTYWQPQPWMFTLLLIIHLAFSGWGFYKLMRAEGLGNTASIFSAVAWMATPRLIGYIGGGQMQLPFSISWTPWLMLAFRRAADRPGFRRGMLAGACLAITFVADVQWGAYSAVFAGAYGLAHFKYNWKQVRKAIPALIGILLFAFALTAGLALPMLEFMGYTRRAGLFLQNSGNYAIEPLAWLGMIFPQYGLLYELVIYFGIVPLIFSLLGMARRQWFWLGAAIFSAFFAMGSNSFLYPLLNSVTNIASWLRVPSRIWFAGAFSLISLAGWGLDGFLASLASLKTRIWVMPLVVTGIYAVCAANLLWYDGSQLISYLFPVPPVRNWLESQPGLFRVYSPDGSIPLPSQLQQANGVNPMHLAVYANYLGKAANIEIPGYSVSVPNIYIDQNTPVDTVDAASHPDTTALGLLNVKYLVSKLPLQAEGLNLVQTFGDTKVYENLDVRPRAWLEGGRVAISSWSPNRIELESNGGGGTLVLSEIMYPGWQAWVDGNPATVETVEGLLRGVALSAGKHQVIFEYRPLTVYLGAGISIIAWIAFIVILVLGRNRKLA